MWLMTPTKTRPHKPMLAEWTSEILSLSQLESQSAAEPSADWGAETMQDMCGAWACWRKLFLGTHVKLLPSIHQLLLGQTECEKRKT